MSETLANGRFLILETLHADDLQIVRRCRDTTVGREVLVEGPGPALRELAAGGDVSRAVREARALARVDHPGVQRLLDVFEDEGGPLLVLEPVAGETLAERLEREGPLPADELLTLARDLADVLAAVHAAGVVHRSLDAKSVLLPTGGGVRLRGFRLAKMSSLEATLTATSLPYEDAREGRRSLRALLPRYPAPEQLGGESASARTDLFGLGCVLFLAATGADAYDDLVLSAAPRRPVPLARAVPDAPAELARAVDACVAWSPLGRPKSAEDLRATLRAGDAPPAGAPPRPASRARPARPGVLAAALALVVPLGLGAWWLGRSPEPVRCVTYFDASTEGLEAGMPVRLLGLVAGTVEEVTRAPDRRLVQVTAALAADEWTQAGLREAESESYLDLRAHIGVGGGASYLDLVLDEAAPVLELSFEPPARVIPSILPGAAVAERGLGVGAVDPDEGAGHDRYSTQVGRSYTFLVGIGAAYAGTDFDVLPNAERDVRDVEARLAALPRTWEPFEGTPLIGEAATKSAIEDSLFRLLEVLQPDDRVFLYFACHGERYGNGDTAWMIPYDAVAEMTSSYVSFSVIDDFLQNAAAKHVLVALDCCYAGRLSERVAMRSTSTSLSTRAPTVGDYEKAYLTRRARGILCSGGDVPVQDGARGGNSPFAAAFLGALEAPDRVAVTSSDLHASIDRAMLGLVAQRPTYATFPGKEDGDFVFFLADSEQE